MDSDETARCTAAVRAMYAADGASHALGIELVDVAVGAASVRMTVTEQMLNGHGTCHGGYLFLLADTAFSLVCNSYGMTTVAAAAQVTFVAPVRLGEHLLAHAVERTRYGRRGVFDVTVRRADSTVVAEFRGHSHATTQPLPGMADQPARPPG